MTTRNQAFTALLALGAALQFGSPPTGFVHTARRPRTPQKLVGLMPALCQGEYGGTTVQRRNLPPIRVLEAAWFIYHVAADDDSGTGQATTADMLDAIDALFPGSDNADGGGQLQTLNGIVSKVWIEGQTDVWGGNVDSQVLIVVPLRVMLP